MKICSSGGGAEFDTSNWNLDLQELEYNMSRKDMNDAKIHHLLAEELYKPARRVSSVPSHHGYFDIYDMMQ